MYDNVWGYYLRDGGEFTCEHCTFLALEHEALERENGPRAWRAAVRLARMTIHEPGPDDVYRILRESSLRWVPYDRVRALRDAMDYHSDEVSACFDGQESNHGEYCGQCMTELTEPWATCAACGRDDVLSALNEWAQVDRGDTGDDGPTIICGTCAEDWRDTVNRAGAGITDDEWEAMYQATDCHHVKWGEPHPGLSLVTEDGRWAPGRVLRIALPEHRWAVNGQQPLALAM